ncbi:molybdopterin molybdotransferase MoeA [Nonomuraea cavernae]|uniref:molybdopterin molybdotransferase MoeA n=1 Tax=Nonomuraea cavernae TaxID=2045107 RepID=UPI0033F27B7C
MTVAGPGPHLRPQPPPPGHPGSPGSAHPTGGSADPSGLGGPGAGSAGPIGVVGWEVARRIAAAAARPGEVAEVPLPEARGCRLAGPLRALVAVPGADVAAMDGYAVAGAPPWRIVGRVLAGGRPHDAPLRAGEAVEIATGAPVPDGTTAVLPYEHAAFTPEPPCTAPPPADDGSPAGREVPFRGSAGLLPEAGREVPPGGSRGGWVVARGELAAGRHVRRRGEDIAEGAVVLGPGTVVTPVVLGLAAGLGHDVLRVRPRPAVTVLVTGDEVVDAGLPEPGRVRDAIGPFLPGLVEWAGGRVTGHVRLPDGAGPLRAALATQTGPLAAQTAPVTTAGPVTTAAPVTSAAPVTVEATLADAGAGASRGSADVVVVCGASSRGPADHLRAVLAELGAEVLVDGVAVRPGHPQLLARLPGGPLVAGLPGNPYAALGAALTLLVPVLDRLTGTAGGRETSALAGPVRPHPDDTRLVAVRRTGRGAVPVGHDRPGSLWGAALADALAVVPPGWDGEHVELLDLPGGLDRPFTRG